MPRLRKEEKEYLDVFPSYISATDHPSVSAAPMDIRIYYFLLVSTYTKGDGYVYSEFTKDDLQEYFDMTEHVMRPYLNTLYKQGWVVERNGSFYLGNIEGDVFTPLLKKPESEMLVGPGAKKDADYLEPWFKQLSSYVESYGLKKRIYLDRYLYIYPEMREAVIKQKFSIRLAVEVFSNIYFIAYGAEYGSLTKEDGFVLNNVFKQYKDVGLTLAIISEYILNFHKYRNKGVPSPKVLSFMYRDIHAEIEGLTKQKQKNEKTTRRSSRSSKPRSEF